jgi:hypothetical protein
MLTIRYQERRGKWVRGKARLMTRMRGTKARLSRKRWSGCSQVRAECNRRRKRISRYSACPTWGDLKTAIASIRVSKAK